MHADACPRCHGPLGQGDLVGQCPRCLAALAFAPATSDPTPGSPLLTSGGYEFLREIGRGGMGVVYEARQLHLNRRVAVKLLPGGALAQDSFRQRFKSEGEAAARLRHPGIVAVHEVGELDGQPFLAMELVEGPTLADLTRSQPIKPRRAARITREIALALAHAHAAGVLHRDLKPANILLDPDDHPHITDFGLAKLAGSDPGLTRTGETLGSPSYLPPEAVAGQPATPAGDVYALGAVLYQLLTARAPFAADSVAATLQQVLHAEPVPPQTLNEAVPGDLSTICLKCLAKEPHRRYASASDLADDLRRFEQGEPIRARPVPAWLRLTLWTRRKPALAGVSLALVLAILAGISGITLQWQRAESGARRTAAHLYAADLSAASAALREGDLGRARSLLDAHRPGSSRRPDPDSSAEFTWHLLDSRCQGDELAILGSHPWIVACVAVSPDGRWTATGSQGVTDQPGPCLAVHTLDGNPIPAASPARWLPVSNTVWSVAFTPDSRTLVSAGSDGVAFWDVESGTRLEGFPSLSGHELALAGNTVVVSPNHPFLAPSRLQPLVRLDLATREVTPLPVRGLHPALSPDGQRLAFLDSGRNVVLHDARDGRRLAVVATNLLVFRLRFSPDGTRLVGAGQMTAAKVWDLTRPGSDPRLFRSSHNVWDGTFSPDGSRLVTATSQQRLEIWDTETGTHLHSLAGHLNEVWCAAFTPDGRRVVSGSKDRTVRLWNPAARPTPPHVPLWRNSEPAVSPDGSRLLAHAPVTPDNSLATRVWSLPPKGSPAILGELDSPALGFAPNPGQLLLLRTNPFAIEWAEPGRTSPVRTVRLDPQPAAPHATLARLADHGRLVVTLEPDGTLRRRSTHDGRPAGSAQTIPLRTGRPRSFAVSPSGRWVALGAFGSTTALLLDLANGTSVRLAGHRDDVAAIAFTQDEHRLATGSVDGIVRLWRLPDGKPDGEMPGHFEPVETLAFTPDGRTLVSGSPGVEMTLWHLPTRRELARIAHPDLGHHLTFSPDGRVLVLGLTEGNLGTATDRAEIWDTR